MSDSGPVIAAASIQATTKSIQTNINLATLPPGFMSPLFEVREAVDAAAWNFYFNAFGFTVSYRAIA